MSTAETLPQVSTFVTGPSSEGSSERPTVQASGDEAAPTIVFTSLADDSAYQAWISKQWLSFEDYAAWCRDNG